MNAEVQVHLKELKTFVNDDVLVGAVAGNGKV